MFETTNQIYIYMKNIDIYIYINTIIRKILKN
jgi:hypothetical protein